jgi:hypothetical protein
LALTDSQRASWIRTRAKGQRRVLVEQFFVGTAILAGGQSLRALLRGGWSAVGALWQASGGRLSLAALAFGGLVAYVFGVLAWNRMERLYAEATRAPAAPAADDPSRR